MITRQMIRVQKDNEKEINFEIQRLQKIYSNCLVKPSLKPVEVVDEATQDCNMWVDIIL